MNINRKSLRRTSAITALGISTVIVIGLTSLGHAQQAQADTLHAAALHAAEAQLTTAQTLAGTATVDSTAGTAAEDAATGHVLDKNVLTTASAHIAALTTARANLLQATKQAQEVIAANTGGRRTAYWNLATLDSALAQVRLTKQDKALITADKAVTADKTAIDAAVTAWKAQQARIAAQKAAAAAAAGSAAAQAGSQAATAGAGETPAPPSAASSDDKLAIAQATFARYGFSNVVYNSGASDGHYAATDMSAGVIYVQLTLIPTDRVASVCLHEYQHILQGREYGGYAGAVAHYGSVLAMEKAADEGAIAAGATWTDYVG